MIIKRTFDTNDVLPVLSDPTIWATIVGDYTGTPASILKNKRKYIYLLGCVEDVLIGMAIVHPDIRKKYYCHVHILPEFREQYSAEFGTEAIEWVWANTSIPKLHASIPEIFPNVKAFAESQGFVVEAFITNAYACHTNTCGKWQMSLTRSV